MRRNIHKAMGWGGGGGVGWGVGTLRIQRREDSFSGDVGDIILRLWLYLVCTSAAVVRDAAYPHLSSVNKAHAEQIRCLSMCAHTHTQTDTELWVFMCLPHSDALPFIRTGCECFPPMKSGM